MDYEYRRQGTANLFVCLEPLAGWRHVEVTSRRTSKDFAEQMRALGWNDKAEVDRWIREDAADDRKNGLVWRPCVVQPKNPFDAPAK